MSVVYFIRAGEAGPIKIGYTASMERRFAVLQTGSPETLHIIATLEGGRELERRYHVHLAAERLRAEWFKASPAVLDAARQAARGLIVAPDTPVQFVAPAIDCDCASPIASFLNANKGNVTLSSMAAALHCSVGRLSQIKSGDPCSVNLALAIEAFTAGAVDAATLSSGVRAVRAPVSEAAAA